MGTSVALHGLLILVARATAGGSDSLDSFLQVMNGKKFHWCKRRNGALCSWNRFLVSAMLRAPYKSSS